MNAKKTSLNISKAEAKDRQVFIAGYSAGSRGSVQFAMKQTMILRESVSLCRSSPREQ
jgi:hypothetical protein